MNRRTAALLCGAVLAAVVLGVPASSPASFAPVTNFPAGASAASVAVADFNTDTEADLAVANFDGPGVSILLGDGNGGFGAPTSFTTGTNPRAVAAGDFNGDTNPDLAVANQAADNVSILLGNGSGGFGPANNIPWGPTPVALAVGNMDTGDTNLDVVVVSFPGTVRILHGNGSGGFTAGNGFPGMGSSYRGVTLGQFNPDVDSTLDVAAGVGGSAATAVFYSDGADGYVFSQLVGSGGNNPSSVAVGDFNGDTRDDLAVPNDSNDTVGILLGDGNGFGGPTVFGVGDAPYSVAVGNFSSGAALDLAVANNGGGVASSVSILAGDGSGGFGAKTNYPVANGPFSIAAGLFNADLAPDLVTANFQGSSVSILLNRAAAAAAAPGSFDYGTQPQATLSAPHTFTVTNTGQGDPLAVNKVVMSGTNPSDFLVSRDTCTGEPVADAATCEIDVRFAPATSGPRSATLEIRHPDSPGNPATVALTGTGGTLPAGPPGTNGLTGPQGPPGRDATVTCKPKGKRVKCAVAFTASSASTRASALLSRAGHTYARGSAFVSEGSNRVPLVATGAVPSGRYLLTVKVSQQNGKVTVTKRKVTVG